MADHGRAQVRDWEAFLLVLCLIPLGKCSYIGRHGLLQTLHPYCCKPKLLRLAKGILTLLPLAHFYLK